METIQMKFCAVFSSNVPQLTEKWFNNSSIKVRWKKKQLNMAAFRFSNTSNESLVFNKWDDEGEITRNGE